MVYQRHLRPAPARRPRDMPASGTTGSGTLPFAMARSRPCSRTSCRPVPGQVIRRHRQVGVAGPHRYDAHVISMSPPFGMNADMVGVQSGVTTLVDQGGPSCMTLPGFRHSLPSLPNRGFMLSCRLTWSAGWRATIIPSFIVLMASISTPR